MGWFGRDRRVALATNAPPDWPKIRMDPADLAGSVTQSRARMTIAISDSLSRVLDRRQGSISRYGATRFVKGGVVYFDLQLRDRNGAPVPVVAIPHPDAASAGRFARLCELAGPLGLTRPIFYSMGELVSAEAIDCTERLSIPHFAHVAKPFPGEYAMWWADIEDPIFRDSPLRPAIRRAFEAIEGYEPLVIGEMFRQFGEENCGAVELPEGPFLMGVEVGGHESLLSLSREKGLRLLQRVGASPLGERLLFWEAWADMLEDVRDRARSRGIPRLTPDDMQPSLWWRAVEADAVGWGPNVRDAKIAPVHYAPM